MASSKTTVKKKPPTGKKKAPEQAETSTTLEAAPLPIPALSSKDRQLLQRVSRFLINIASAGRAARALREGYTTDEHKEGWRLWRIAAGESISLDHWLDELHAAVAPERGKSLEALKQIDAFENLWFPRTRAIVRRVVPREHRETFEGVFFKDLTQQPLGPGVLQSVSTYLQRVEELTRSKLPGARVVASTLAARGLTDELRKQMREQIRQLATVQQAPSQPPPDPKARHRAAIERTTALEDLSDWYNDWRTTLTPIFPGLEGVALGFVTSKGGRRSSEEAVEDEGQEEPSPDPGA
ncbi:MAG: hypothetical protein MUF64_28505 [Polyangiaceae bacterium]|jgi:hypothetical protein|nr:hypothetical protein [Polyangiaceae bacterium]